MNGHHEGPEPDHIDRERERSETDPNRRQREARHEFYPGDHGFHDSGQGRVYGQTHAAHGYYAHREFDPRPYERRNFEHAAPGYSHEGDRRERGASAPGQYERDPNDQDPFGRRAVDSRYATQHEQTRGHWNPPYRVSHEEQDPRNRFPREPDRPARPFGQQLFNRGPSDEPRYFGTGSQGAGGGPAFTGGAYGVADERSDAPHFREIGFNQGYYGDSPGGRPFARGEELYGSRTAGMPQGQPRRRYRMGPKGYQRSDERLREDISERLMQSYHIDSSEVTVQVEGGKVILEGTVPDRYMKHAIEDLADAAPGVQDIENRIRVAPPWAARDTLERPAAASGAASGTPAASAGAVGSGSASAAGATPAAPASAAARPNTGGKSAKHD